MVLPNSALSCSTTEESGQEIGEYQQGDEQNYEKKDKTIRRNNEQGTEERKEKREEGKRRKWKIEVNEKYVVKELDE